MKICVLFVYFLFCFVLFIFFVFRYLEKFTIQLENRSHKTTEGRNFDKRAKKKKTLRKFVQIGGYGQSSSYVITVQSVSV